MSSTNAYNSLSPKRSTSLRQYTKPKKDLEYPFEVRNKYIQLRKHQNALNVLSGIGEYKVAHHYASSNQRAQYLSQWSAYQNIIATIQVDTQLLIQKDCIKPTFSQRWKIIRSPSSQV